MASQTSDTPRPLQLRVEAYAGYRGEQEPRKLYFGRRAVEVVAIIDRWLAPDHRYFKCQGDDGGRYIIRYDEHDKVWELAYYEQPHGTDHPV